MAFDRSQESVMLTYIDDLTLYLGKAWELLVFLSQVTVQETVRRDRHLEKRFRLSLRKLYGYCWGGWLYTNHGLFAQLWLDAYCRAGKEIIKKVLPRTFLIETGMSILLPLINLSNGYRQFIHRLARVYAGPFALGRHKITRRFRIVQI